MLMLENKCRQRLCFSLVARQKSPSFLYLPLWEVFFTKVNAYFGDCERLFRFIPNTLTSTFSLSL
ncbi:hypothetical protein, partial [Vibrio cincinnatiensis]|uniref:hypothetical protein n=1 Tax=Vibrio cincinnatiensis TaxID=675 RepID=UPI001EDCE942